MRNSVENSQNFFQPPEKMSGIFFLVEESLEATSAKRRGRDAAVGLPEEGIIGLSGGNNESSVSAFVSRKAMNLLEKFGREIKGSSLDEVSFRMSSIIESIIERSFSFSREITPKGEKAAAASFLAAKILETPEGLFAIVKSVGNSKAFIWRANGRVDFLGAESGLFEDSELQAMVSNGELIQEEADIISQSLTETDFAYQMETRGIASAKKVKEILEMPQKTFDSIERYHKTSISFVGEKAKGEVKIFKLVRLFKDYPKNRSENTQAVGSVDSTRISIHTAEEKIQPGDRLILASGGLTANLSHDDISGILSEQRSLSGGLKALRQTASERSRDVLFDRGTSDEISINGIEVFSKARRAVKSRLIPDKTEPSAEIRGPESLPEVQRIKAISEVTAMALGLAEAYRDPEIEALEKEIEAKKVLLEALKNPKSADWLTKSRAFLRIGRGMDARVNWVNNIVELEKRLRLLKLKKETMEDV